MRLFRRVPGIISIVMKEEISRGAALMGMIFKGKAFSFGIPVTGTSGRQSEIRQQNKY